MSVLRPDRLAALHALSTGLAATCSPSDAAGVVVSEGPAAVGAAAGAIWLLVDEATALQRVNTHGFATGLDTAAERLSLKCSHPVSRAARAHSAVFGSRAAASPRRCSDVGTGPDGAGFEATAALPLMVGARVLGVLELSFSGRQRFSRQQRAFAGILANMTAQALERTRLVVDERLRAAEVEALSRVGAILSSALEPAQLYERLLDHFSHLLPYDHAAILLHDHGSVIVAGSRGAVQLPIGSLVFKLSDITDVFVHGLAGKPALIRDTSKLPGWLAIPPFVGDHAIRSVLVVPLEVDGQVVGTFNADSFSSGFYTDRHLALAITLAERLTQALRNARLYAAERARAEAAEELARLRSEFVALVSHELRTPLTAIVGYGELLEARWEQTGDGKRRASVRKIVASAHRQQRLVDDLLLLGRLEGQALIVQCSSVELAPLIRTAVEEVRGSYRGQHIEMRGSQALLAHADAGRLVQVVVNLVDNAAKYSLEGSPVEVRWSQEGTWAMVRVQDRGPGVSQESGHLLFSRFGRLPNSPIRAGHGGTGLGLYLGQQLARAMGGDLALEQTGPAGSTFLLRLPLSGETPRE